MDYQSEGTKSILVCTGGTYEGTYGGMYGGTIEVRTEVLAYGMMARVRDVRTVTTVERATRASSERRTSSE